MKSRPNLVVSALVIALVTQIATAQVSVPSTATVSSTQPTTALATQPTTQPTTRAADGPRSWSQDHPRSAQDALTPVDTLNPKLEKTFFDRKKNGNINVVFLGDSITRGWASKGPQRGRAIWDQFIAPYGAANFGVSSEHTEHILGHIARGLLDDLSPKAVVILIGTNNIGHTPADQPEWTAAGVEKICQVVHEKCPAARILLMGVFPRDGVNSARREAVQAINAIISKLDDGKTVKFLDIKDQFLSPDGELPADLFPDRLHPNEKGYQIWAEAIKPILDEWMK